MDRETHLAHLSADIPFAEPYRRRLEGLLGTADCFNPKRPHHREGAPGMTEDAPNLSGLASAAARFTQFHR